MPQHTLFHHKHLHRRMVMGILFFCTAFIHQINTFSLPQLVIIIPIPIVKWLHVTATANLRRNSLPFWRAVGKERLLVGNPWEILGRRGKMGKSQRKKITNYQYQLFIQLTTMSHTISMQQLYFTQEARCEKMLHWPLRKIAYAWEKNSFFYIIKPKIVTCFRNLRRISIFLPPELHHELEASIGAHPLQHCVLGSFDLSLLVVMTPRFVHRAPFLLTLLYFVQGPRSSSHVSRFFLTLALYLLQGIAFFRHLRTRRSNTGICRRAREGKVLLCK